MRNRFSGLKLIHQEMKKIRAKQIRTSPMQLWIALDDGRRVEIRTKHQGDKPMIGDPVFDEEGKLIREGELTTSETGEKLIIADSVIIEIIDTTLESEPAQKWNRKEVQSFQGKAFQMLSKKAKKMGKESLIPDADFKQLRQKLSLKTMKAQTGNLSSKIIAFEKEMQEAVNSLAGAAPEIKKLKNSQEIINKYGIQKPRENKRR